MSNKTNNLQVSDSGRLPVKRDFLYSSENIQR